jgi:hypothetical protein
VPPFVPFVGPCVIVPVLVVGPILDVSFLSVDSVFVGPFDVPLPPFVTFVIASVSLTWKFLVSVSVSRTM